jgi:hypothetical protein
MLNQQSELQVLLLSARIPRSLLAELKPFFAGGGAVCLLYYQPGSLK